LARPKASDHDLQRERILTLAITAFAELGYPSASMSQLAHACGTSKARLYHYFPSKEAILFESLDRYMQRLCGRVAEVRGRGLPPREELAGLVRALLVEYRDSRPHHIALLNDVKSLAPGQREPIEAREREIVEALADTVQRAAPGRFASDERKPATMALLGMINFTFAWLDPAGPMSYERYADMVIDLWERGLAGREVPSAAGTTRMSESAPQRVRSV
jgi:AcrR family transcriptional regulator